MIKSHADRVIEGSGTCVTFFILSVRRDAEIYYLLFLLNTKTQRHKVFKLTQISLISQIINQPQIELISQIAAAPLLLEGMVQGSCVPAVASEQSSSARFKVNGSR